MGSGCSGSQYTLFLLALSEPDAPWRTCAGGIVNASLHVTTTLFVLGDEQEMLYKDLEPAVLSLCSVPVLGRNYICLLGPRGSHLSLGYSKPIVVAWTWLRFARLRISKLWQYS